MNLLIAKRAIVLFFAVSCFLLMFNLSYAQPIPGNEMRAHFIDVGQADATLLEFSCGAVLIDAGAQDDSTKDNLVQYLKRFFARRADLGNTLDLVVVSHDHKDHDLVLQEVAANFHIKNYIDNGHTKGSGEPMQGRMESFAQNSGIRYESFSFDQIMAGGHGNGLTDGVIEPLHCAVISPQISLLSGRMEQMPAGWKQTDFKNENNHSVVVRIQFGKASFLFTGDLETAGDQLLLDRYAGSSVLDVDVWKVSHHGAVNGTSQAWVDALTPKYAVICCGKWFSGDHTRGKFNTYHYGHPRVSTLNFLSAIIPDSRAPLDSAIVAFNGITTNHIKMNVTKNIYCTAWDGNITIKADTDGTYAVVTGDQ